MIPPEVSAATAEYRENSDDLQGFFEEVLELAPEQTIGQSELFKVYEAWNSSTHPLGVELKLVNGTVTANGKVSSLDPYLKCRIAKAKAEIKVSLESGAEMLTIAHENLEKSTSWKEVETALAMVKEAVDGRVIGYDDAQHFVEQAKQRARFIPAAGALGG